ncbi:MAG: ATP-binding protein [Planctomycetota bacterium]
MDQGLHILLVEDDADTRANLLDILQLDGHRVESAENAEDARRSVSKTVFEIIVLDRKLPDATADELLPELLALNPDAHVIVMTGFANLNSTIAAFRAGAADYLLKPVNVDALRNSLEHIQNKRRVENQLVQKQEFANLILNTADAVILVLNLQGCIVQVNDFFQRITGWTQEEIAGQDWFEACIPATERERVRDVFLQTAEDSHSRGIVNPVLTKGGEELQIRWSNNTLRTGSGETAAVLAVGIDVTDHIAAEQQLLRAERLAGVGQTMAAIAHESRNALQRIHAGVEMLEEIMRGDPETEPDLLVIKRAAKDLNRLLEEVRSFAAPINLHLGPCDLEATIRRAWTNVVEANSAVKTGFEMDLSGGELTISADRFRIEQVFRNLFENAIAACEQVGRIHISGERTNAHCRLVVSDSGPGLTLEQQERIFEPFFTTKAKGTGLGMAIVKRIILAHDGTIEVLPASVTNSGAQIELRLPLQPTRKSNPA